jgi:hypothetical protein
LYLALNLFFLLILFQVLNSITSICSTYSRGGNQQESVQGAVLDVVKVLYDSVRKEKSFDSSQRAREGATASGIQFEDAFDIGGFGYRDDDVAHSGGGDTELVESDRDDGSQIDLSNVRATDLTSDRCAEVVGDLVAGSSENTVLIPSSGNDAEVNPSADAIDETQILPSNEFVESSKEGLFCFCMLI